MNAADGYTLRWLGFRECPMCGLTTTTEDILGPHGDRHARALIASTEHALKKQGEEGTTTV